MQKCTLVLATAMALLIVLKPQETEARMTFPQLRNALKGVSKGCISKTGVDPDLVKKSSKGEFQQDHALACYFLCVYSGIKVVKDGRIDINTIIKQIDMMMPLDKVERSKEVTRLCDEASNSDDDCERTWQFTKCYWDTDSSIYFFP